MALEAIEMKHIFVTGTCDTKGVELDYLCQLIRAAGEDVTLVDVGTGASGIAADIPATAVAGHHPDGIGAVFGGDDRGKAVTAMSEAFARFVESRDDIAGIIGIGGGGGTSVVTAGMRRLPIGLPKVMVSTLASGDVGPYVGPTDITMMYSVTDIAGLNSISRKVLANAAHAIAGMVTHTVAPVEDKPAIGLTMFGVTTTCVTTVADTLRDEFDCLVFHATGSGGQAMEKLVDSGMLQAVIDVTTTEVCDYLFDGVLSAGPGRLDAIARTGIPYIGSVGALDMVNFWAMDTVPAALRSRNLYAHNPQVTLMRTTADECRQIGLWIADKLNACEGPVRLLIPEKGVSGLDAPGKAFHDPDADAALFDALESTLQLTDKRRLIRLPLHINDSAFADALVTNFREKHNRCPNSKENICWRSSRTWRDVACQLSAVAQEPGFPPSVKKRAVSI